MRTTIVSPSKEREIYLICLGCGATNIVYASIAQKAKGRKECWRCKAVFMYEEEEADASRSNQS